MSAKSSSENLLELNDEKENNEEEDISESEDNTYQRKRFKYPDKRFGHEYFDPPYINKKQFGHKKYIYYTEHRSQTESVRSIVKDLPKFNKKLTDSTQSRKSRKIKGAFYKVISYLFGALALVSAIITKVHRPPVTIKNIISSSELISGHVDTMAKFLSTSQKSSLLHFEVDYIGQCLNDSTLMPLTIRILKQKKVPELLYKFISSESTTCESYYSRHFIKLCLYLLHDITAFGHGIQVNRNTVLKVLSNCADSQDVIEPLYSVMISHINNNKTTTVFNGIAKNIYQEMIRESFGPWDYPPAKFYAFWSTYVPLTNDDQNNICKFVDFAILNHGDWSNQFKSMMGLLSKNVKCNGFDQINMQHIYSLQQCQDLLMRFSKQSSDFEQI